MCSDLPDDMIIRPPREVTAGPNRAEGIWSPATRARIVMLSVGICAALTGCGSSHPSPSRGTSTSAAGSAPAAATAGLSGRVLTTNELKGFIGSPPSTDTNIRGWLTDEQDSSAEMNADAARLRRLGFVRGAVENLSGTGGTAGLSLVEEFHSAQAARAELAGELAEDKTEASGGPPYAPFAVSGIPGADGLSYVSGGQGGINIAFVEGPYYYEVGQELAPSESAHTAIANLVAAAQHLSHRVSS